jgi:predicted DNA repair protein MutK
MFMVGGGILVHGIPGSHDVVHHAQEAVAGVPAIGPVLAFITPSVLDAVAGLVAGALALVVVTLGTRLWRGVRKPA